MNPYLIVALIKATGSSLKELAESTGYDRSMASHVAHGRRRSLRLEKAISDRTRTPLHVLWPAWYADPANSTAYALCHPDDTHHSGGEAGQQ